MKLFFKAVFLLLLTTNLQAQEDLKDWYHKDPSSGVMGSSVDKTYSNLLKGMTSETVIVAIIDSGVDIEHEDLAGNIWVNLDEIPDNGIDDDKNGYIDDVNGWNFIGGPDGKNVGPDTYEVTRLYGKYKHKFENAKPELLNKKDKKKYEEFLVWKEEVEKQRNSAESALEQVSNIEATIKAALDGLKNALADKSLDFSLENINSIESDDQLIAIAQKISGDFLPGSDITTLAGLRESIASEIDSDKKRQQDKLEYAYNPDFNPRKTIVKDNYRNSTEKYYGNNDVEGPDALHGTHVAGIVGAVRNNDLGMNGVADNVLIMSVRTVPDGDERDKDVANAIRYAVDNGASIINMSFGKGYSWTKDVVDDAVRYAEKHDVLLVHAAGNSAQNNDITGNFPNDKYRKPKGFWFWKKKKAKTWIEVGALSYNTGEQSVAPFSNYGTNNVDIFAPGMKIYSTLPDDKYRYLQGTSMAAPVVAGAAAVLRSYFPKLKAEQVKKILMKSTESLDFNVTQPGSEDGADLVPFKSLSKSGGVLSLTKAVKMAKMTKGKKKIKTKKKGSA
ncbi:MAG: S8 family serine peptidase [Saprospiraceae bacterium]